MAQWHYIFHAEILYLCFPYPLFRRVFKPNRSLTGLSVDIWMTHKICSENSTRMSVREVFRVEFCFTTTNYIRTRIKFFFRDMFALQLERVIVLSVLTAYASEAPTFEEPYSQWAPSSGISSNFPKKPALLKRNHFSNLFAFVRYVIFFCRRHFHSSCGVDFLNSTLYSLLFCCRDILFKMRLRYIILFLFF